MGRGVGGIVGKGLALRAGAVLLLMASSVVPSRGAGATDGNDDPGRALDREIAALLATGGGPPGVAVVIDRDDHVVMHRGGVAEIGTARPPRLDDAMRVASVAKAFSAATALSLVKTRLLRLETSIGERLPGFPPAWSRVTLAELLDHTSGIPDFSTSPAFLDALRRSLLRAPRPIELLRFVFDKDLGFVPGTKYEYSNSDNIIVGLMVQAATGRPYASVLDDRVVTMLHLSRTSLPAGAELPSPFIHGYESGPDSSYTDVSTLFAAGWTWASGGIVSSPRDLDRFIRAYVRGRFTDASTRRRQFAFVPGASEPIGPGRNSAGLGLFRYQTRCGTVYGHTGNTPGYTQFAAATRDGSRSVTVSLNTQITPKTNAAMFRSVRRLFESATCAAIDHNNEE